MLVYNVNSMDISWGSHAWRIVDKLTDNHIDRQQIRVIEDLECLLQDESVGHSSELRLAKRPFDKSLENVITDYLTGLVSLTKDQMTVCGYREEHSVQFTCNVPATWPGDAKQTTLNTLEKVQDSCGFTNVGTDAGARREVGDEQRD